MRGRKLSTSPLVAMIAFATLIGAGGLVYAHWFAESTLQGDVNTGGIGVGWFDGWTNDDGIDNGEGEGGGPGGAFDAWGPGSSADPSADGRYDKDVGACWVDWIDGDYLHVHAENTYPSYHCTVSGALEGRDGVPVKAVGLTVYSEEFQRQVGWLPEWDGPTCWDQNTEQSFAVTNPPEDFDGNCDAFQIFAPTGDDFYVEPVLEPYEVVREGDAIIVKWDGQPVLSLWAEELSCGVQVDPGWWYDEQTLDRPTVSMTFHVEQGAFMYDNYNFTVHPRFVNWNEFEEGMCGLELIESPPEG